MLIQLEPSDYLAASILHARRTFLILPAVGLLLGVVGAARLLSPTEDGGQLGRMMIGSGGACLVVYLLSRFVLLRRRTRRIFRQQKGLQRPFEMDWSGDSLKLTTETGNNSLPWSHLLKWREGKRLFLLYLSDVMFYIVPKRAFPDEAAIDEFREVLRSKITA
ncbi:MAG: YcxB family protein [Rhizomicrobium sp.]